MLAVRSCSDARLTGTNWADSLGCPPAGRHGSLPAQKPIRWALDRAFGPALDQVPTGRAPACRSGGRPACARTHGVRTARIASRCPRGGVWEAAGRTARAAGCADGARPAFAVV